MNPNPIAPQVDAAPACSVADPRNRASGLAARGPDHTRDDKW